MADIFTTVAQRSQREAMWFSAAAEDGARWMYALHLHKAAGTELCALARRARMTTPVPYANCMPEQESHRYPRWPHTMPWELVNGSLRNITFFMIEWTGFSGPILRIRSLPLVFVTAIRHPAKRIQSNWQMDMALYFCKGQPRNLTFEEYALRHKCGSYLTNNYEVNYLAAGSVGSVETKLAVAKSRLHLFSAIVIVERWASTIRLLTRFGWPDFSTQRRLTKSRTKVSVETTDPALWARVCHKNRHAISLYEAAVDLSQQQVQKYESDGWEFARMRMASPRPPPSPRPPRPAARWQPPSSFSSAWEAAPRKHRKEQAAVGSARAW